MSDYGNEKPSRLPVAEKRACESKDFELSWAVRLDGDSISTSAWVSDDLTVVQSGISGSKTTVRLSGGTGGVSTAENTIVTSAGYTYQHTLAIRITGKVETTTVVVPPVVPPNDEFGLLLEDGSGIVLLETGDILLLEDMEPPAVTTQTLGLEAGDSLILESGDDLLMEANG